MEVLVYNILLSVALGVAEGCKTCTFFNTYTCVEPSDICDGLTLCKDGDDELFCDQNAVKFCLVSEFQCSSGDCIQQNHFCDGVNDCTDNSDEFYCEMVANFECPYSWRRCGDGDRCIPGQWWCDGKIDCSDYSDELKCVTNSLAQLEGLKPIAGVPSIKRIQKYQIEAFRLRLVESLLKAVESRKNFELPRAVLALFLASPGFFASGNTTGSEIRDRFTIRVLSQISRNKTIRGNDLALYVQALLVTCQDPHNFYGRDLVSELRAKVDQSLAFTNPFDILALCNAGGPVTARDVVAVSKAFESQHRPFWTDVQAIATMAMQCLSSYVTVDEGIIENMKNALKNPQFRNWTVKNLEITALIAQALGPNDSFIEPFKLPFPLDPHNLTQKVNSWGKYIRKSFYVLPVISGKSFLDINDKHCPEILETEEESLARVQEAGGDKFVVQYSVWIGSDVDLGRSWRVRVQSNKNTSLYDLYKIVSKLDKRHNVTYMTVEGKPYVRSLLGKEDDPELGIFWFTYVRSASSRESPTLIESSPVDVEVTPSQEFIMWYKTHIWSENIVPKAKFFRKEV